MSIINRRQLNAALSASVLAGALPKTATAQQQPTRIGMSMSSTGSLAAAGKSALVAGEIWRRRVNEAGGLLGRPVEFVTYDDQSSPSLVPAIYAKLLDIDKVDLLLSGYATNQIAPALPIVIQRRKLFLALHGLANNDEFRYDRYFHVVPYGPDKATWLAGFMALTEQITPAPKTIGFLYADAEFAQNSIEGLRKEAVARQLKVAYEQRFPSTIVDMSALVRGLKAADPDVIVVLTYPQQSAAFVRSVSELGLGPNLKLVGGQMVGLQLAPLLETLGPSLNGFTTFHFYVPEPTMDSLATREFLDTYQAQAAREGVDQLGFYVPTYAYARLQVLQQAVTATGSLNDGKLAEYIAKTIFDTVVGPIRFGKNGERPEAGALFVQFQGVIGNDLNQFKKAGREVIVGPPAVASGKLKFPFSTARS